MLNDDALPTESLISGSGKAQAWLPLVLLVRKRFEFRAKEEPAVSSQSTAGETVRHVFNRLYLKTKHSRTVKYDNVRRYELVKLLNEQQDEIYLTKDRYLRVPALKPKYLHWF